MSETESGNKRIAKNTAVLYVRMLVMMFIGFFTARVMLNALGVEDYGINNVVGGLVSMFSLLSSSLAGATGRFLTFGLGQGDINRLKAIFAMSINIHVVLAIAGVFIVEIAGVWFLNNKMNIPSDRLYAANWVLQCSVVGFALGMLSVPYNSVIIAHEKMAAFAYMTIFDAVFKLVVVFAIYYYGGDRLILLSVLLLFQSLVRQAVYWLYCKRKFEECVYSRVWDKQLGCKMFSFAIWNFIGSTAGTLKDQGVNVVVNMFSGPAVNAARGIAMQVNGLINQFIGGFTTALNPQIIKNYAAGELHRMHRLVFQGTRLSYFLFMFLSIPVFFEIESILYVWLGQVPEHTVLFARLALILSLSDIISNTLITAQAASGDIKRYQQVVGGILLLNMPVSYVLMKFGTIPEATVIVAIVISQICLVARLWFLRRMIKLPVRQFLREVYLNVLVVTVISFIPPLVCYFLLDDSVLRFFVLCAVSAVTSLSVIYYVGCNSDERDILRTYAAGIKNKFLHRR